MKSNNESFVKAEVLAKELLQEKGYYILYENYLVRNVGEIDIIAMDGDTLVFTEVRYRANAEYGDALETVQKAKQKKLIKAASEFLARNNLRYSELRFDVVGITGEKITHIKDAFWARW